MLLRALQSTQIHTGKGPRFVAGPTETEDGFAVDGEIVEVEDNFTVNPAVWDVVVRSPDGRSHTTMPHPVKGVRYPKGKAPQAETAQP